MCEITGTIPGMAFTSHEKLLVWQKAMDLVEQVYRGTSNLPAHELYGLVSQMRRCAVSILSNIAEGRSRGTTPDYMRFLTIALGSTAEISTQIQIAHRLGYIGPSESSQLLNSCNEIARMVNAVLSSLRQKSARANTGQAAP